MFSNIGGKIKTLARVICWLGIICSVFFGAFVMRIDDNSALLGFLLMCLGPLLSWVSSFTLYGFGQLIENTDQLVINNENSNLSKENDKHE